MTDKSSEPLDTKALKALLDPPVVELAPPAVHLHLADAEHALHQRMSKNGPTDSYERYRLSLRAEPLRQESRMHRFLCDASDDLPNGSHYLLAAMRKAIHHCHGRTLLAHEPGLGSTVGLAMLLQEYLLRGLVHRSLVLVPAIELGYWEARLNAGLDEPFVAMSSFPSAEEDLPDRLLLTAELFAQELPEHLNREGHYQLIAVSDAKGLRKRRSRPWRNLLSLSPSHLLLQSLMPFEEKPVELHGYLALLGVPELPPAARLKRELGPADGPITPETRQLLRPFLDAAVLRNTHPTTPIEWAPRSWKTIEYTAHAATQRLRGQVESWLKLQQTEPDEENPTPPRRHNELLHAAQSSAAAIAATLQDMLKDDGLSEHREQLQQWQNDANKVIRHEPRLQVLRSLLRDSPNSRVLIFCHHEATAKQLEDALPELVGSEDNGRIVASSFAPTQPDTLNDPDSAAIMLATDQCISPLFQGPIDIIVHFDLPWDGVLIDARSNWLLHAQGEQPRHIISLVREESHDAQLLETLQFRLKLDQLAPEELPMIQRFMASEEGIEQTLWLLLREQTSTAIEQLSKELLNARKQYRRLLDLNQRLFLDDYAL